MIKDPGKGKSNREEQRQSRLKAWKRLQDKTERDKARTERQKAWEARYGIPDSAK